MDYMEKKLILYYKLAIILLILVIRELISSNWSLRPSPRLLKSNSSIAPPP